MNKKRILLAFELDKRIAGVGISDSSKSSQLQRFYVSNSMRTKK